MALKSKILQVENTDLGECSEVIVLPYRNGDGEDVVKIIAWHIFEGTDLIQEREVPFSDLRDMDSFVRDYSTTSAQDFVDSFQY